MEACVATYPVIQLRFKVSSGFAAAAETMHFRIKCCQASNPRSPRLPFGAPPSLASNDVGLHFTTTDATWARNRKKKLQRLQIYCYYKHAHTHTPSCSCCTCCKRVQVRTALAKQKYKLRNFRGVTRHPRIIQSRVKIYMEIPQKHENKPKKKKTEDKWRKRNEQKAKARSKVLCAAKIFKSKGIENFWKFVLGKHKLCFSTFSTLVCISAETYERIKWEERQESTWHWGKTRNSRMRKEKYKKIILRWKVFRVEND